MLHEDLTAKALEACFEVAKELGSGFLESVYEKALVVALRQKGLEVKEQFPLAVKFRGQMVGEFFADILLEDKVIIELKAARALTAEHQAQVINYLNATGIEVGLLVNFGNPRLEYKRLHRYKQDPTAPLKITP
ncbi:MAG TPA: GxxExxY protein [Pyrinomonadaceae bacterium]|nr:GxxExxY protein [Pyrinomonadaceae bacterium]